ncbi:MULTISPECIES: AbrB/MazE/SpoVT family DNA-binding domain-containing protein [unclassified Gemella]|uniref:AbrB/MazE/SpoVT family DNA-binding domain-containing protein n=1 Tax=unclassified Gemella TaxID=2624949 RepID=UPI0010731D84|nr:MULTISPECIES: AbrB/MazE/SpoVT family DNA-binding domain-containing protein [unclassified Gemella]MBF0710565.1 PbsX family transcriptional regulator [Gemella sp. GL1.1]MBF0746456.1 PbsX family transcriptional regulator [Gemella sp. 19428wG2_WT2a]NYS27909.1 PbsX family transcriptional regulator [Gemella sp. GL1]TFU60238.1 PbsX family transcriptional regulator [Gemella sp. WT2a]
MSHIAVENVTTLKEWGNSHATRIPNSILKKLNLSKNQKFSITISKNSEIVLTPINDKPKTIQELFANWTDDSYRTGELDWGESVGNEIT